MKTITILILLALSGCAERDYFWYPVKLNRVICGEYESEVYTMTNSVGWRNYPYFLDKETRQEVILNEGCVLMILKRFPVKRTRGNLTQEQREYLVEGFYE